MTTTKPFTSDLKSARKQAALINAIPVWLFRKGEANSYGERESRNPTLRLGHISGGLDHNIHKVPEFF